MKDYTFNIRIAKEDLDTIRANAKKANMTTTAYLINRALCDNQILVLEDLRPVCHELRKIGVNINQLTMLAHQGRITCDIVNNSWHIFLKHSHTYAAISNES